jgi:hypothetical protein
MSQAKAHIVVMDTHLKTAALDRVRDVASFTLQRHLVTETSLHGVTMLVTRATLGCPVSMRLLIILEMLA